MTPILAPDLAQMTINFLQRVQTTGLAEAARLMACAEGLEKAGNAGLDAAKAKAAEKEKVATDEAAMAPKEDSAK